MRQQIFFLFTLLPIAAACESTSGNQTGTRRFNAVLTPEVAVQGGMTDYLNMFHPKPAGRWAVGDALPEVERNALPANAQANATVTIEGEEWVLEVEARGLPPPNTVIDPVASVMAGEKKYGQIWDVWLTSLEPTVFIIQMGTLVADTSSSTTYRLRVDSRTQRDFNGNKLSVSSVSSVETGYPNTSISLYDVQTIGIDVENLEGAQPPEEPSGQIRLSDIAPFGVRVDWSKPELDDNVTGN